ncbi:MAG TPA: NAD(+) diphosphatase [Streptosporangiaceae bacterium]
MKNLAYSGGYLDRASDRRADPGWVATLMDSPKARLIPVWRDHCLVSGDPPAPVTALDAGRSQHVRELGTPLFLGLDGDAGLFAVDLSALGEERAVEATGAERVGDLREFAGTLGSAEAAILAYARGLAHWNRNQQFCGTCGAAALGRHAGHLRFCGNEACGRLHFPRIEPAVITLVESAGPPQRCLMARHNGSAPDSYALLAGFVEIGESLEDAVRREVAEEAGVSLATVDYVASQAWPFPAGLMAGFRATAASESVTADGKEIVEARWFTRAELSQRAASGHRLGRVDSIDRHLLRSWLDQPGSMPS